MVEPYLWAAEGMLWPLVPEGVRLWTVERLRRIGDDGTEDLAAVPDLPVLDHASTYLVDVTATG